MPGEAAGVQLPPGSIVRVLVCGVSTRPCERLVRAFQVQPVSARVSEGAGHLLRDGGEPGGLSCACVGMVLSGRSLHFPPNGAGLLSRVL